MSTIDQPGSLYLGRLVDQKKQEVSKTPCFYEVKNFVTHAVCLGMTGSGKTGLAIATLEELALKGIPALIIDPKGDMGNLMLNFPDFAANSFLPWIDASDAQSKETPEKLAQKTAETWKKGLADWGIGPDRLKRLKEQVDIAIYTPASTAGIPLSILNSFAAPSDETLLDAGALRDRILSVTSSLLGLMGLDADPVKSREYILISTIFDDAWRKKQDLDLPELIQLIQKPPFDRLGVFDTDSFYPPKERSELAMKLNLLLASPGFQAWMEGEPLDIQKLLFTNGKKPRVSILSIAHLSDSERLFFVTLFLNEVLTWMRRQSGTSNLRALLYMDEIFGYFPPIASPPTKMPMLTLLKQARAFGLGVMLATQNPVDLDYKGLANCGTWFVGKLQTERDRARVLEGLRIASNGELDDKQLDKLMASTGNRTFLLRSIYLKEPVLFQTRWAMSYLRGPLTLPQIKKLMQGQVKPIKPQKNSAVDEKVLTPSGIEVYYLPSTSILEGKILGLANLHFVDAKTKIDVWKECAFLGTLDGEDVSWESISDKQALLTKIAPDQVAYKPLPALLLQSKNYGQWNKSLAAYIYQNESCEVWQSKALKQTSEPGETEEAFRQRLAKTPTTGSQAEIEKMRTTYEKKIVLLQDRLRRAEGKAEEQKNQVEQQKIDTFLSFGSNLLGGLLGGITKGTVSGASTSLRKMGRIGKEKADAAQAEESVEFFKKQLESLQAERDEAISKLSGTIDPASIILDKVLVKPRKSDINIQKVALVWS